MVPGKVRRQKSRPLGTPGVLMLENGFGCDSLELGWHDNERGRSCIVADTYLGKVWWSHDLKRPVIRLEDKHGRKDCLLHNGNWAADDVDVDGDGVREVTQVHGCTEVGHGYGEIQRPDKKMQWGILHSGATLAGLIDSLRCPVEEADTVLEINGERQGFHDVELTYLWAEGCAPAGQA